MNKILRESLYFRKDSNISRFLQILQHIFPNMIYTSANYTAFSPNMPQKRKGVTNHHDLPRPSGHITSGLTATAPPHV